MSFFLRQSTAGQSRAIGPFVDDTDYKTAKTALTINDTDIKLVKNGGASSNKNSGGGTHRVNGFYGVTFDATDSDTVGELQVSVLVTGALLVFRTYTVLEEAVYDLLFASGATFPTNFSALSISASGRVKALVGITRNVAYPKFMFLMTDATTHAPLTGLVDADFTVKSVIIDGAAPLTLSDTIAEDGLGYYSIDLTNTEVDGKNLAFTFEATDADPVKLTAVTSD